MGPQTDEPARLVYLIFFYSRCCLPRLFLQWLTIGTKVMGQPSLVPLLPSNKCPQTTAYREGHGTSFMILHQKINRKQMKYRNVLSICSNTNLSFYYTWAFFKLRNSVERINNALISGNSHNFRKKRICYPDEWAKVDGAQCFQVIEKAMLKCNHGLAQGSFVSLIFGYEHKVLTLERNEYNGIVLKSPLNQRAQIHEA
jgi:hypothetical protein